MSQNSQETRQKASSINDPGKEKKEASAPLTVEDNNDGSKDKRNIPGCDVTVEKKRSPPSKKRDKIDVFITYGELVQLSLRLLTKPKDDPALLGDTLVKSETRRNKSKRKSKGSSASRSQEELSSKDSEERLMINKTKGNKRRFSKPLIISDESTYAQPADKRCQLGKQPAPPPLDNQHFPSLSPLDYNTKCPKQAANICKKTTRQRTFTDKRSSGDVSARLSKKVYFQEDVMPSQKAPPVNEEHYPVLSPANGPNESTYAQPADKRCQLGKQPAPPPLDNQHFPSLSPLDYNTKCPKQAANICKKNTRQRTFTADKRCSGDIPARISKKVYFQEDVMPSQKAPPVNEEHYPVLSPANGPEN
ncbi:hypothetical protein AC249_AIPGENE27872 [Exaiptasia diaphana]|nr:hypothetical protein AC249_AIPGENE27872 [Exaiptasia diaphana]